MRKTIVMCIVAMLAMTALAPPAKALLLEEGSFEAHLRDGSTLYVPSATGGPAIPRAPRDLDTTPGGAPNPDGYADTSPQIGDEQRVVFNVDQIIYQAGGTDELTDSMAGTLTGMIYDLKLEDMIHVVVPGSVDTLFLYFSPLGRNPLPAAILAQDPDGPVPVGAGGVLEVWLDPTPENGPTDGLSNRPDLEALFDPNGTGGAPFLWSEAGGPGGRDGYPTINNIAGTPDDSTLFLQSVFDVQRDLTPGPTFYTPLLTPNTGVTYVASETLNLLTGEGVFNLSYVDVVGGSLLPLIVEGALGPHRDISLHATLVFPFNVTYANLVTSDFSPQSLGDWQVKSDDPIEGALKAIPEPATMSLLGLSLLGLVGVKFRKKS